MGLNGGASNFAIEKQAVNEATFSCPDELGWQPKVLFLSINLVFNIKF